ncbi:rifin [Plasmodium falciparum RAJ116]|uniref:Rifin n=1 Tax=Plasmodium falciparum RAJ116 TaxID=580058 RepID=A0A0L0CTH5_PLAFA|nr:rifin [Plasmodium falciparum RAJ116]
MPKYDSDEDMNSVKENFDRQTSQRFEEYEERMITQRQKYKEQRDQDIQKIILKDKIKKSLEEKVEKCCLICGCGLGGGVAPFVGLFGGLAVNEMKKVAAAAATEAGIKKAIEGVGSIFELNVESTIQWREIIHAGNYNQKMLLSDIVNVLNNGCEDGPSSAGPLFCQVSKSFTEKSQRPVFTKTISEMAGNAAEAAGKAANEKYAEMTSVGTICSDPIVISAIVVVIIAVILLIIYLILRYRRKQKMNKKLPYTKLLNQ